MSTELKELNLDPLMREALPLGFARILVNEDLLDEEMVKRVTHELTKYRHSAMFVRHPDKPISKLEP